MSGAQFSCRLADVPPPPRGLRFRIPAGPGVVSGFLVREEDDVRAWRNRCAHRCLELDLEPGLFFTTDNRYLICSTHAALFDARTGRCVHGPCVGQYLRSLPVAVDGDSVIVTLPPAGAPG